MHTLLLEELTWPEVKQAMDEGMRTVVIYCASIEQHGWHLAQNTDTVIGYSEAIALAKNIGNALVAPVIRPGLSEHHMAMPGSLTLRPEIFAGIVQDYIAAYVRHGFEKIVVTSSHGGNFNALEAIVAAEAEKYPAITIVTGCSLKDLTICLMEAERKLGLPLGTCGGHACDFETSVMLAIAPQHVRMERAKAGFVGSVTEEFLQKFFEKGVTAVSEVGVIGDPTQSTAERGMLYCEALQSLQAEIVRKKLAME